MTLYALGYLLVEGLKIAVGRPRPFLTLPDVTTVGSLPDSYSFPSGHTALAFLTAALFRKKWLWIFAVFVGISRIYLGVHYPADVTFGAIFGIIYGFLYENLQYRRYRPC
ncbi:MAG: phosphatase PAP2 family protein [Patescibacteria group bacterium]